MFNIIVVKLLSVTLTIPIEETCSKYFCWRKTVHSSLLFLCCCCEQRHWWPLLQAVSRMSTQEAECPSSQRLCVSFKPAGLTEASQDVTHTKHSPGPGPRRFKGQREPISTSSSNHLWDCWQSSHLSLTQEIVADEFVSLKIGLNFMNI